MGTLQESFPPSCPLYRLLQPSIGISGWRAGGNGCVPEIPSTEGPHLCWERSSAPLGSQESCDCFNPAQISVADAAKRSICFLWWVAELDEGINPATLGSWGQPECWYWLKGGSFWGRKWRQQCHHMVSVERGSWSLSLSRCLFLGCGWHCCACEVCACQPMPRVNPCPGVTAALDWPIPSFCLCSLLECFTGKTHSQPCEGGQDGLIVELWLG